MAISSDCAICCYVFTWPLFSNVRLFPFQ
jgi:hypothetical protein